MQFAVESRNYNRIDFYLNQHLLSGRYCIPLFLEYFKLQIETINYMKFDRKHGKLNKLKTNQNKNIGYFLEI